MLLVQDIITFVERASISLAVGTMAMAMFVALTLGIAALLKVK